MQNEKHILSESCVLYGDHARLAFNLLIRNPNNERLQSLVAGFFNETLQENRRVNSGWLLLLHLNEMIKTNPELAKVLLTPKLLDTLFNRLMDKPAAGVKERLKEFVQLVSEKYAKLPAVDTAIKNALTKSATLPWHESHDFSSALATSAASEKGGDFRGLLASSLTRTNDSAHEAIGAIRVADDAMLKGQSEKTTHARDAFFESVLNAAGSDKPEALRLVAVEAIANAHNRINYMEVGASPVSADNARIEDVFVEVLKPGANPKVAENLLKHDMWDERIDLAGPTAQLSTKLETALATLAKSESDSNAKTAARKLVNSAVMHESAQREVRNLMMPGVAAPVRRQVLGQIRDLLHDLDESSSDTEGERLAERASTSLLTKEAFIEIESAAKSDVTSESEMAKHLLIKALSMPKHSEELRALAKRAVNEGQNSKLFHVFIDSLSEGGGEVIRVLDAESASALAKIYKENGSGPLGDTLSGIFANSMRSSDPKVRTLVLTDDVFDAVDTNLKNQQGNEDASNAHNILGKAIQSYASYEFLQTRLVAMLNSDSSALRSAAGVALNLAIMVPNAKIINAAIENLKYTGSPESAEAAKYLNKPLVNEALKPHDFSRLQLNENMNNKIPGQQSSALHSLILYANIQSQLDLAGTWIDEAYLANLDRVTNHVLSEQPSNYAEQTAVYNLYVQLINNFPGNKSLPKHFLALTNRTFNVAYTSNLLELAKRVLEAVPNYTPAVEVVHEVFARNLGNDIGRQAAEVITHASDKSEKLLSSAAIQNFERAISAARMANNSVLEQDLSRNMRTLVTRKPELKRQLHADTLSLVQHHKYGFRGAGFTGFVRSCVAAITKGRIRVPYPK